MTYRLSNWTQELCNTLGTGDIYLAGVVSTNQTRFRDGLDQGEVLYSILDGSSRECGIGVFNGTNQIVRSKVHATLISGVYNDTDPVALDLSGTAVCSGTYDFDEYKRTIDMLYDHDIRILSNKDAIESVESDTQDNTNQINSNTARITINEEDILELQAQGPNDSQQIQDNKEDIAANELRITQNEADILINETDIATNSVGIAVLDDDIKFREASVTSMSDCNGIVQQGSTSVLVFTGIGEIVDSYTDVDNQDTIKISWPEEVFNLLTNGGMPVITGLGFTTIGIEPTGDPTIGKVVAFPNGISSSQRRTNIRLGLVEYMDQVITDVSFAPLVGNQVGNTLYDMFDFMDFSDKTKGFVISPTTIGDLSLWRSSGTIFTPGINYNNNKQDPNVRQVPAFGSETSNIVASLVSYNNGNTSVGASVAAVPNDAYELDGAGVISALPTGDATIHYIFETLSNSFYILYGQTAYPSYDEAITNLFSDRASLLIPTQFSGMVMLGQLVVAKGAVAGWDGLTAEVYPVDGSSGSSGGGGGGAVDAIDVAYSDTYGTGANVQAALDSVSSVMLTTNEHGAVDSANAPTALNPFATTADIDAIADPLASEVSVVATGFTKHLSATDIDVQTALDTLDIASDNSTQVDTTTTNFNNNLSAADDTVQKALDTLDNLVVGGVPPAASVSVDTLAFDGNLSNVDTDVQKALETIDEMDLGLSPIASNVNVDTSGFNNHLSATDSTVQKALNTIDDIPDQVAVEVPTDTTNFNGRLSAADTTVQAALDTIDNIVGITIPPHNDLEGIQGGLTNKHYHINATQWDGIVASNSPSTSNPYATIDDLPVVQAATATGANLLINGDMSIWQRSPNTGVGEIGQYVSVDRWACYTSEAGNTVQLSRVTRTTSTQALEVRASTAVNSAGCQQVIENGDILSGKDITISFDWVPMTSYSTARVTVIYGSAASDTYLIPDAAVEERKVMKVTLGQFSPGTTDLVLRIDVVVSTLTPRFEISKVALVEGHDVSGEFPNEMVPDVLLSCQRYFQKRSEYRAQIFDEGSEFVSISHTFMATMHHIPAMTIESSSNGAGLILASIVTNEHGMYALQMSAVVPVGMLTYIIIEYSADAELNYYAV